jgi:hypothetical protein
MLSSLVENSVKNPSWRHWGWVSTAYRAFSLTVNLSLIFKLLLLLNQRWTNFTTNVIWKILTVCGAEWVSTAYRAFTLTMNLSLIFKLLLLLNQRWTNFTTNVIWKILTVVCEVPHHFTMAATLKCAVHLHNNSRPIVPDLFFSFQWVPGIIITVQQVCALLLQVHHYLIRIPWHRCTEPLIFRASTTVLSKVRRPYVLNFVTLHESSDTHTFLT